MYLGGQKSGISSIKDFFLVIVFGYLSKTCVMRVSRMQ